MVATGRILFREGPRLRKGNNNGKKTAFLGFSVSHRAKMLEGAFRVQMVGQLGSFWWSTMRFQSPSSFLVRYHLLPTFPLLRLDLVASVYTLYWLLGRAVPALVPVYASTAIGH